MSITLCMLCVNCQTECEETFSVELSNGDVLEAVPLCPDCFNITDTL